jgi:cytochrome b
MNRTYIWDLPTRLVHWLLVALVFFSWGSAEYNQMDLHRYSGYALLGVVLFRLYWGFFGSSTARFTQFVKGPRAVLAYLRSLRASRSDSEPTAYSLQPTASRIGHNPLGALSVLALLAVLLTQIGLGLFAVDVDGLESGPLSYLVSFDTGRACAEVHEVIFNVLLAMIVLHVAAIFFYLFFKRDNLIAPMITGNKAMSLPTESTVSAPLLHVVIGLALSAAVVWLII